MRKLCVLALFVCGCHSAGQYGFARTYEPNGDEEDAQKGVKDYDPVMVQRAPDDWKGKSVSVFGVVKVRNPGPGGTSDITLSVRTLEPRNLCDTSDEDTCRVTVSDREHAIVHTLVTLEDDDDIGKNSVGPGSLMRVIGTIRDTVDPSDGSPVIRSSFHRHWPRNFYVTTADREHMRR
jgi:hypothetical protein